MLDDLMELIHINLQKDSLLADTLSRVGVGADPCDVLEPEHIARSDHHDLLVHKLLLLLRAALGGRCSIAWRLLLFAFTP